MQKNKKMKHKKKCLIEVRGVICRGVLHTPKNKFVSNDVGAGLVPAQKRKAHYIYDSGQSPFVIQQKRDSP